MFQVGRANPFCYKRNFRHSISHRHPAVKRTSRSVVLQFVAFRGAKGRPFAERKATDIKLTHYHMTPRRPLGYLSGLVSFFRAFLCFLWLFSFLFRPVNAVR